MGFAIWCLYNLHIWGKSMGKTAAQRHGVTLRIFQNMVSIAHLP